MASQRILVNFFYAHPVGARTPEQLGTIFGSPDEAELAPARDDHASPASRTPINPPQRRNTRRTIGSILRLVTPRSHTLPATVKRNHRRADQPQTAASTQIRNPHASAGRRPAHRQSPALELAPASSLSRESSHELAVNQQARGSRGIRAGEPLLLGVSAGIDLCDESWLPRSKSEFVPVEGPLGHLRVPAVVAAKPNLDLLICHAHARLGVRRRPGRL